ncbi:MAG: penicillin acylase family protein [Gemmatimonadaceae bacterium]|nr:penicillin acylase family protein [Gemmatimonadaceae bacterium]
MFRRLIVSATLCASAGCAGAPTPEVAAWEACAATVTIQRDDWGIAHVSAKTDADAIFGMLYAQAEDDFNRIETNFLTALGRLAEAEGASAQWRDLRMRLFIDPDTLKAQYAASPAWLKALMDAWADGLNYYLHTHPQVRPRVLTRFEPWMALAFSEGSIGGDIESVSTRALAAFYGDTAAAVAVVPVSRTPKEPSGSNGIAIAPAKSASGKALLLINPHTSFFFRDEVQVTSDEGLNAYGAVTWGQFFIYQGFNERTGWMHTSSSADAIDEFLETVDSTAAGWRYKSGTAWRELQVVPVTIRVREGDSLVARTFPTYRTHHGPIVRREGARWVSVGLMNNPVTALTQSYARTKAKSFAEFKATMDLHTNSSNNTIYADADGVTAYFHANFVPKRDPRFDWRRPVDGSNAATDWKGVHTVDESPLVVSPANGWLYNTNNFPYSAAGPDSPKKASFPAYMDWGAENPRGIHAMRVLSAQSSFTIATLRDAAYDSWLPAFDQLLPALFRAYDRLPAAAPERAALAAPIDSLKRWDRRWSAASVPTSLAIAWGDEVWTRVNADANAEDLSVYDYIASRAPDAALVGALTTAVETLTADFGRWETPWGERNRFQRVTADIVQPFSDSAPSIAVPFASARWGSLASFGARKYPGTKRMYGTSGNSFVAIVEFGDKVRAVAVTAGGVRGDASSKHFNDQATRYADGALREVYFYPEQRSGHIEREYRPGQ